MRYHVVTQVIPGEGPVQIGRVGSPALAALLQVALNSVPPYFDQRPDNRARNGPQCDEPIRAGSPEQIQEKRLNTVVSRVCKSNSGESVLCCSLGKEVASRIPAGCLDIPRNQQNSSRKVGCANTLRERSRETFVAIRIGAAKSVIDMGDAYWKSQFLEDKDETDRIGTAGNPYENPIAPIDQPMFFDCPANSGGEFQMPEGGLEPPT